MKAGDLDRRITVQVGTRTKDRAGGELITWADSFKRWAKKKDLTVREMQGASQVVREGDTEWTLRFDSQSEGIDPATNRFVWNGRIYEITGLREGAGRRDQLVFITSFRPDLLGARARNG